MSNAGTRGFLAKLRTLTPAEALALAEAMLLVTLAAPMVRRLSLKRLGQIASRPIAREERDPIRRAMLVERVSWVIDRASKRSKLRALCFERGLAAQIMLRRRGIDSTLFYGMAPGAGDGTALDAHVWVVADGVDVTGGITAGRYVPLATFPAGRQAGKLPTP